MNHPNWEHCAFENLVMNNGKAWDTYFAHSKSDFTYRLSLRSAGGYIISNKPEYDYFALQHILSSGAIGDGLINGGKSPNSISGLSSGGANSSNGDAASNNVYYQGDINNPYIHWNHNEANGLHVRRLSWSEGILLIISIGIAALVKLEPFEILVYQKLCGILR